MEDRLNRHDLTGAEWERLAPLLPANPRWGGRWADHRTVINGVFFRVRTNITWGDLPPCHGNRKTVHNRRRRWSMDGTRGKILDGVRAGCDEAEGEDWTVRVDAAVVRARQHAAGARHRPPTDFPSQGTA
ncbi:transposase [Streptosporangium canum]|uniref:transposase n=1 Tax=Streptosporangium canum TaxID=324952 RepID=UPI003F4C069C